MFPVAPEASPCRPKRTDQIKSAGRCGDLFAAAKTGESVVIPKGANTEQRFGTSLVRHIVRKWAERIDAYMPRRLRTSGAAGTRKSFVIHALCAAVRNLLGADRATRVFAPTGVSVFQVGGVTGYRLFRLPTGGKSIGRLAPLAGDSLRAAQDNLIQRALLIWGERGMTP